MIKTAISAIALTCIATAASAQSVEVGTAKWASLPELKAKPTRMDDAALTNLVEGILRSSCKLKGQAATKFDITVPYAVLLEPNGKVARVLVAQMHCTPLEVLVGQTVLARADAGDFLPTGETKARWYASAANFNME